MTDDRVVRRRNVPAEGHPTEAPRPRQAPAVVDVYHRAQHWPDPVQVEEVWRCRDCRRRLRWYRTDRLEWRLRHYRP